MSFSMFIFVVSWVFKNERAKLKLQILGNE